MHKKRQLEALELWKVYQISNFLFTNRRLLLDDSRGVAEALNETDCVADNCKGLTVRISYRLLKTNSGYHFFPLSNVICIYWL